MSPPHAWRQVTFSDIARRLNTRAHEVPASEYSDVGAYPIIDQGQAAIAGFSDQSDKVLSCPDQGLIVFGDHTCVVKWVEGKVIIGAQGTQVIQSLEGVSTRFLSYLFQAFGPRIAGYGRHFSMLAGSSFMLPSLREQQAIAAALADADEWIASLDARIEKQLLLAAGMRQRLIRALTRLPGFREEWADLMIGDLLTVRHGRSQEQVETPGGRYPILATGGEIGRASEYLHPGPSVLIGRKGTIDRPRFMDTPFWSVDTLFYTEIAPGHDARFVYYLFCEIDWSRYNEASGVPSLNSTTIERIRVRVPPHSEQVAVAAVLHDLDTELEGLRAERQKVALIKEGMMLALLSGEVRLPTTDLDAAA